MINACSRFFGGENAVKVKLFAALLDLKKDGYPEVQNLPSNATAALKQITPETFQKLMFISGRKLDTAFPKIQHWSDDDIAGVETSNVFLATNGSAVLLEEFGTACKLQAAAMRELMSLADEPENPEEAAATEELRAKLLQLESRR